ncbi:MAG: CoA-binding protein [Candidatus Sulfobium sp.]|jgi:acyl-CoA synthetase (NDP forming)
MSSLDLLFRPKSIAVVGAAHTDEKLGGVILKNLRRYRGKVYPVNPRHDELMGLRSYYSLSEIPETVDLSLIARPASEVPDILRDHKGKAKFVVIISAGFAETGHKDLQDEIREIGKEAGVRILGPNCMGVFNPYDGLDTFFLPPEKVRRPKRGNVAIVSQSGAFLHCIFGVMHTANVGISRAVAYGNAVDIDESDLYEYLAGNRETDVVISYIESVRDGRRFLDRARLLTGKKPLLVLKSGKGSSGQAAAYSHTGRLAGRYEVFTSILRQSGIREARDFDELTDSIKALSYQRPSRGKKVLIVTNGGGSGVLASDECMRQGLEVTKLPDHKAKKLEKAFPDFYGVHNPFDVTAQVKDRDYITVLDELHDEYDGFVLIALTGLTGITEELAGLLKDFRTRVNKPIVFHTSCGCESGGLIDLIEKAGIPVYLSPERAVKGLKSLLY